MNSQRDATEMPEFGDIPDPLQPGSGRTESSRPLPALDDSPHRARTRARQAAAFATSIGWLGAHLVVYGIRTDLSSLPWVYVAAEIALPFGLATASLVIATSAGRRGLGANIGLLMALALLGPISFWSMALGAPLPRIPEEHSDSWLDAFVCLDITLAWAAVPVLCAALSLRNAFPSVSLWRSSLVGAACGLFAGGVMNLHCANVDRFHMLIGHGIPVLVAVLAGAVLIRRMARS